MIGDHSEKKNAKKCPYRCADENFSRGDILRGAVFAKPELVFLELAEQRPMSNERGRGAVMVVVVVAVLVSDVLHTQFAEVMGSSLKRERITSAEAP
jgi:hypothetical protein